MNDISLYKKYIIPSSWATKTIQWRRDQRSIYIINPFWVKRKLSRLWEAIEWWYSTSRKARRVIIVSWSICRVGQARVALYQSSRQVWFSLWHMWILLLLFSFCIFFGLKLYTNAALNTVRNHILLASILTVWRALSAPDLLSSSHRSLRPHTIVHPSSSAGTDDSRPPYIRPTSVRSWTFPPWIHMPHTLVLVRAPSLENVCYRGGCSNVHLGQVQYHFQ